MNDALESDATGLDPKSITRDWLQGQLSKAIDEGEEIDPDENLLFYGLDSIFVMQLSLELEKAGVKVTFPELAQNPTLNGWWELIASRLSA